MKLAMVSSLLSCTEYYTSCTLLATMEVFVERIGPNSKRDEGAAVFSC